MPVKLEKLRVAVVVADRISQAMLHLGEAKEVDRALTLIQEARVTGTKLSPTLRPVVVVVQEARVQTPSQVPKPMEAWVLPFPPNLRQQLFSVPHLRRAARAHSAAQQHHR